jgi:hypothetical protein
MTTRSSLIVAGLLFGSAATAATLDAKTQLRVDMRKLWDDHAAYTRSYVISAIAGLPDTDAVAQRLLRNQDDIGNAIKPYYGEEAGRKLATLLRDHIKIASEVVKAAKAGQTTELTAAQSRWSQNGKDIAALLSGANPNWSKADLEAMFQRHLDLLTDQVSSRLKKNWAAEMKAYDAGHDHMMMLADALTDGIEKQFPDKFPGA